MVWQSHHGGNKPEEMSSKDKQGQTNSFPNGHHDTLQDNFHHLIASSHQLGHAIISQHFPHLLAPSILETYFFTSLLHDIGTTPQNLSASLMSFEFYGGFLALDLLRHECGAPKEQAEAVAEAIIRHQDLGETGTVQAIEAVIMLATVFGKLDLLIFSGIWVPIDYLIRISNGSCNGTGMR